MPPASNQPRPARGTRSSMGTAATTTSQPMAKYRPVDAQGWERRSKALSATPASAKVQTTPNKDQPQGPANAPKANGV